jgi:hypothetical protein
MRLQDNNRLLNAGALPLCGDRFPQRFDGAQFPRSVLIGNNNVCRRNGRQMIANFELHLLIADWFGGLKMGANFEGVIVGGRILSLGAALRRLSI